MVAALALAGTGLRPSSLAWFVGAGCVGAVAVAYGSFFLTWLEDGGGDWPAKFVGLLAWLALSAPLFVEHVTSSPVVIALVGAAAAGISAGVLELLRRRCTRRSLASVDA